MSVASLRRWVRANLPEDARRGAVTVLGGPHARCYPEDAQKYYDYVLGFTEQNYNAQQRNFGNPGEEDDQEVGNVQAGAVTGGSVMPSAASLASWLMSPSP